LGFQFGGSISRKQGGKTRRKRRKRRKKKLDRGEVKKGRREKGRGWVVEKQSTTFDAVFVEDLEMDLLGSDLSGCELPDE